MMASDKGGLTWVEAKAFLKRNGIEWSMDHLKQQVRHGKIKSIPGDNGPPKIPKSVLMEIVKTRKMQNSQ